MPMRIEDKKVAIDELQKIASKSVSAVIADYHGISVSELTSLRQQARESKGFLKVIRNTLAKRALSETIFSCLEELLVGPSILAFSLEDPSSAAKLVNDFSKINKNFMVKGLSLGDSLLELSKLTDLANLPSREEAISQLCGILNSTISKLAIVLNQIPINLVRVMESVKQQKLEVNS